MSREVKHLDLSHTARQPQIQDSNPMALEPPSPGSCQHHATSKLNSATAGIIRQPFPGD